VSSFGARAVVAPGSRLIALALVLFAQVPVAGSYFVHVMPSMLLLGIAPASASRADEPRDVRRAAARRRPRLRPGHTTAQIGGALGLAVLATLSSAHTRHLLTQGHSNDAALTGGYHLAFWIAAALTVAAIAIVPAVLGPAASRNTQQAQEEDDSGNAHGRGGATLTEPAR